MHRLRTFFQLSAVALLTGILAIALTHWFDLEQEIGLPWLFHVRGPVQAPDDAVIVAIDEESIQHLGLPDKPRDWPRGLHAELVGFLSSAGAKVIVFDLTFDTPSPDAEQDALFAKAARAAGNVLVTEALQRTTQALLDADGRVHGHMVVDRAVAPVPVIEQAVAGRAPFMVPKASRVDAYWTFRNADPEAPTLPVVALKHFIDASTAGQDPARRTEMAAALADLPARGDTTFLNLYGPPRSIRTVSYSGVLEAARGRAGSGPAAVDAAMFAGRAVFIGFSAATPAGQGRVRDDYRTVFSQPNGLDVSGVELLATAFSNLVEDRRLAPLVPAWQLAIVSAWALVLGLIHQGLRPVSATGASSAVAALYLVVAVVLFAGKGWWLPSIIPVGVQLPAALLAGIWFHHRVTKNEREAAKRAFGYFVPSTVVEQLLTDGGRVGTQANRVVFGCCLATDAAKYTTLAETMAPADLGRLLNAYFAELFVPVERSGGVVVDVVGDAMVAIWVTATSHEAIRQTACEAVLEIVAAVDRFNQSSVGRPALPTRFGLHSGDMLIGTVGASNHYEFRAVGDIVNTASRLEGLNKVLGTTLLVSQETIAGLDGLVIRPLGSFRLAGKAAALPVAELLGRAETVDVARQRACALFAKALQLHDTRQWQDAAALFAQLLAQAPHDAASRLYLSRCEGLIANPPGPDWGPVIVLDAK